MSWSRIFTYAPTDILSISWHLNSIILSSVLASSQEVVIYSITQVTESPGITYFFCFMLVLGNPRMLMIVSPIWDRSSAGYGPSDRFTGTLWVFSLPHLIHWVLSICHGPSKKMRRLSPLISRCLVIHQCPLLRLAKPAGSPSKEKSWLVVWNIFYIYWEKSSQLTNIFQSVWNHQPESVCQLIGLREKLQEHPIFHGKIYGFL